MGGDRLARREWSLGPIIVCGAAIANSGVAGDSGTCATRIVAVLRLISRAGRGSSNR